MSPTNEDVPHKCKCATHYNRIPRWFLYFLLNYVQNSGYNLSEEYDLFLRIARLYHFDYIPEPLAKCRVHEKSWGQKYRGNMREEHFEIFQGLLNEEGVESRDIYSTYLVCHIDRSFMDIQQRKICDSLQELRSATRLLYRYGLSLFDLPNVFRWFSSRIKNQLYLSSVLSNKY